MWINIQRPQKLIGLYKLFVRPFQQPITQSTKPLKNIYWEVALCLGEQRD